MLVVSSLSVLWLRGSTHRLAFESQPKVEALEKINQGLSKTQLILQHYLADGLKSRKRVRSQSWKIEIFPALNRLVALTSVSEHETLQSLTQLKSLLKRTEALQGEIENLAHSPENLPSKMGYELHARPIYLGLVEEVDLFLSQPGVARSEPLRARLSSFIDGLRIIDLEIQLLLDYGVQGRLVKLVLAFDQAKLVLNQTKRLAGASRAADILSFQLQLERFQEVSLIVAEERRNQTWNQTLYLQEYQLNPLRDQLSVLTGQLDRQLTDAIRGDATTAAFVATTSLILSVVLILVLLLAAVMISIRRSTALTKPIAQLAEASDAFAAGTLGADIPIQSSDELGELTVTFNRMKNGLIESHGRYRAIVDNVADGIITIDQRGKINSYNKSAEQIFGFLQEETVGQSISMLMPDAFKGKHLDFLNDYLRTGQKQLIGQGLETKVQHKNGSLRPVYLAISETMYGGQLLFTGLVRDIRNQKALENSLIQAKEEALVANQLKSRFLANISHEVRTPMNGILGMTELALETDLSANQRRYIKAANGGAKALLKLLNDVLDLSKMEGAHVQIEMIDFNLENLLEDAMESMSMDAQKKGLDFILNISNKVPTFVQGDPTRIRQIFVNLIGNAIKFTEKGQVLLKVNVASHTPDQLVLKFSIEDTGIGIPEDRLEKIFESFTQSDGSTTRNFGGTGLGTTIAKQLIELMGGEISLSSQLGQGTQVKFSLELKPAVLQDETTQSSIMHIGLKEVLVVDDNPTNLSNFSEILRSWNLQPTLVGSAKEAIDRVQGRQEPFDLLIVDVQMPIIDGIDLVGMIRDEPGYLDVPAIFLFSFITPQHQASLSAMGEPLYLFKPVKREELKERILEANSSRFPDFKAEPVEAANSKVRNFSQQYRVLVIEDDPTSSLLLETRLKSQNLQVYMAESAAQAMKAFEARRYDLILMDLRLPDSNGVELSQKFRLYEVQHKLRLTPIFALTGACSAEVKEELRRTQVFQVFGKPVDFQLLFVAINQLFGQEIEIKQQTVERTIKQLSAVEVDGFDLVKGLHRWGDSQAAYLGAIQTFCQSHQETIHHLSDEWDQGRLDQIQQLAHKLKGAAGNIGAIDVFLCAGELETWVANDQNDGIEQKVQRLLECLGAAIESGNQLVESFRSEPQRSKPIEVDATSVAKALEKLVPVIERGEAMTAERLVNEVLDLVGDHPALGLVEQLATEVDGFDFEKALTTVKQAIESLNQSGSGNFEH